MTEVPEHLLQRSKERRAALGLGGGDAPAAEGSPGQAVTPAAASGGEVVPPTMGVPATTESTPAAPANTPPVAMEPAPVPLSPVVRAALGRPKIPRFALPVLAILPLWALIYAGVLTAPGGGEFTDPVLAEGAELYTSQCSGCHMANGSGGTGRPLNNGEVVLTFPDPQGHVEWVAVGSDLVGEGNPYGDPARPGGQRVSQSDGYGRMPGFGDALSPEEIIAVVRYEREVLSGETESSLIAGGGLDAQTTPNANENNAESVGGNVGGEGGSGSAGDATPGGGDSGDGTNLADDGEGASDADDATSGGGNAGGGTGGSG